MARKKKKTKIEQMLNRRRDFYTPRNIMTAYESYFTRRNLRSEYSHLRKIAMQRLERLRNSEYAELDDLRGYFKYGFDTLDKLKDSRRFAYEFTKLVQFLDSDYTLSTIRELSVAESKSLETLHSHGYNFVTRQNYREFAEFMATVNARITENIRYDALAITDIFEESLKANGRVNKTKLNKLFNAYIQREQQSANIAESALSKLSKEERDAIKRNLGML